MKRTLSRLVASLLACALSLALAGSARADGPFDLGAAADADGLRTARGLRTAGMVITLTGVATEFVTLGLWIHAVKETCWGESCRGRTPPTDEQAVFTAAIATAGLAPTLLGIGIPMWAVGSHREEKLQHPTISISAAGVVHF